MVRAVLQILVSWIVITGIHVAVAAVLAKHPWQGNPLIWDAVTVVGSLLMGCLSFRSLEGYSFRVGWAITAVLTTFGGSYFFALMDAPGLVDRRRTHPSIAGAGVRRPSVISLPLPLVERFRPRNHRVCRFGDGRRRVRPIATKQASTTLAFRMGSGALNEGYQRGCCSTSGRVVKASVGHQVDQYGGL